MMTTWENQSITHAKISKLVNTGFCHPKKLSFSFITGLGPRLIVALFCTRHGRSGSENWRRGFERKNALWSRHGSRNWRKIGRQTEVSKFLPCYSSEGCTGDPVGTKMFLSQWQLHATSRQRASPAINRLPSHHWLPSHQQASQPLLASQPSTCFPAVRSFPALDRHFLATGFPTMTMFLRFHSHHHSFGIINTQIEHLKMSKMVLMQKQNPLVTTKLRW